MGFAGINDSFSLILKHRELILMLLTIGGFILHHLIKNNIKIGGETREYFDRNLFGLSSAFTPVENAAIKERATECSKKNPKKYLEQISNTGNSNIRGVKDWYTPTKKKREEASFECQKENIYWDKKLVNLYKKIVVFILSLMLLLLLCDLSMGIKNKCIIYIWSFFNLLCLLARDVYYIYKYNLYSSEIQTIVNLLEENNAINRSIEIEKLQKKIFKRRVLFFVIPDALHKIKSKELHEIWKDIRKLPTK